RGGHRPGGARAPRWPRPAGSPVSAWILAYDGLDPPGERLRGAACTPGNGSSPPRGAAPEAAADAVHYPGTYVAGIYNRLVSRGAGREVENEDLGNAPNWLSRT